MRGREGEERARGEGVLRVKKPGSTSSTKATYSLKLSRSNTKKKISFGKKGVREREGRELP